MEAVFDSAEHVHLLMTTLGDASPVRATAIALERAVACRVTELLRSVMHTFELRSADVITLEQLLYCLGRPTWLWDCSVSRVYHYLDHLELVRIALSHSLSIPDLTPLPILETSADGQSASSTEAPSTEADSANTTKTEVEKEVLKPLLCLSRKRIRGESLVEEVEDHADLAQFGGCELCYQVTLLAHAAQRPRNDTAPLILAYQEFDFGETEGLTLQDAQELSPPAAEAAPAFGYGTFYSQVYESEQSYAYPSFQPAQPAYNPVTLPATLTEHPYAFLFAAQPLRGSGSRAHKQWVQSMCTGTNLVPRALAAIGFLAWDSVRVVLKQAFSGSTSCQGLSVSQVQSVLKVLMSSVLSNEPGHSFNLFSRRTRVCL